MRINHQITDAQPFQPVVTGLSVGLICCTGLLWQGPNLVCRAGMVGAGSDCMAIAWPRPESATQQQPGPNVAMQSLEIWQQGMAGSVNCERSPADKFPDPQGACQARCHGFMGWIWPAVQGLSTPATNHKLLSKVFFYGQANGYLSQRTQNIYILSCLGM